MKFDSLYQLQLCTGEIPVCRSGTSTVAKFKSDPTSSFLKPKLGLGASLAIIDIENTYFNPDELKFSILSVDSGPI